MQKRTLNLIPQKGFEELTASKKIFFWMIGIGRIIVVGTELIAILVWLSRFKRDYDISLLTDSLENKQQVVENAKDLETDVRAAQKKIELIKTIRAKKPLFSKTIGKFTELIPEGVTLNTLNLNNKRLTFHIRTRSATAFAKLISKLLTSDNFETITLTSSNFDPKDESFRSSLSIDVQPGAFK